MPDTAQALPQTHSRWRRWLRHRWRDETDIDRLLGDGGEGQVESAVAAAERRHRGEIRVCVEAGLPLSHIWHRSSARSRATALFGKLGVWDTLDRSGVLLYVLLAEHRVELVADRGVAARVPPSQWQLIVDRLTAALREGRARDGLVAAVAEVGQVLEQHFPLAEGAENPNELPNRVDRR